MNSLQQAARPSSTGLFAPDDNRDVRDIPPSVEIDQPLYRTARGVVDYGHSLMNFPVEERIHPVIEGWKNFLALPQDVKNTWSVDLNNPVADDPLGRVSDPDNGLHPPRR